MAVPVVGVVSSAFFLGETITTALVAGLVLIIAGVTLNLLTDGSNPTAIALPAPGEGSQS